ncbi:MAG: PD-(D/E)XK nuclease family protein [Aestuariibacter sp.]|nr:PD-(D/E)XK nuclease family protein [Aestuariibacter sp.]
MIITQSSCGTLRDCPKMYRLKYIEGWKAKETYESLLFGTLWHKIKEMEALHRPPSAIAAFVASNADNETTAIKLTVMHKEHRKRRVCALPQGVELRFEYPLYNPDSGRPAKQAIVSGVIDGLLYENGEWWIVEYKTASQINGSYITRISLDFQVHLYKLCASRLYGINIVGVIYDVIKKPTIRQKQKETLLEYEQRLHEWYADNSAEAFYAQPVLLQDRDVERQVWMYYQELLWRSRNDYWPRNTNQCMNHYGRQCQFFGYCDSGDKEHVLRQDFEQREIHPELK